MKHQKPLAKALVWMILGALGVWLGFCVFIVLVGLCMFLAMYWKVLVFVAFVCALVVLASWLCAREPRVSDYHAKQFTRYKRHG